MNEDSMYKMKQVRDSGRGSFARYRKLTYGDLSLGKVIWAELLVTMIGGLPGAAGLFLRSRLYRTFFGAIGNNVIFGRNIVFRHPEKIRLGDNVILDDNCVIDAKGESSKGIAIGNGVYIGRNTIVYCKNGDIEIGDSVNISSNCQIFSSNSLRIGKDTVIGAYSYFLSGGEYNYKDETPFAQQSGMGTRGPLTIGTDCWIGARVTILDAADVGDRCVIGAGAVVNRPLPSHSVAAGVPARVIKTEL